MVPVDGMTETTVGRLTAPFAAAGSGGGRKPLLPPLPAAAASQPTVVTVRQALGADASPGADATLVPPSPLRSAPLVTTASEPIGAYALASAPGCAAAALPGLKASGRQQSAEDCKQMNTALAAEP